MEYYHSVRQPVSEHFQLPEDFGIFCLTSVRCGFLHPPPHSASLSATTVSPSPLLGCLLLWLLGSWEHSYGFSTPKSVRSYEYSGMMTLRNCQEITLEENLRVSPPVVR